MHDRCQEESTHSDKKCAFATIVVMRLEERFVVEYHALVRSTALSRKLLLRRNERTDESVQFAVKSSPKRGG